MSLYDLLIRDGEVFIPERGFQSGWDVAISQNKIASVAPSIDADQAERVLDAGEAMVVPGLIDLHTHLGFEIHRQVVYPEKVCPSSGVTTAVDMGSTGAFTFPWYRDRILEKSAVRLYEFINIASLGTIAIHTPYYEEHYSEYIDVQDTVKMIEEHRDYIRGIKVFGTSAMVNEPVLEGIRAAVQAGQAVGLPVAVHVSVKPPEISDILALLRPGDIVTHTYTPYDQGILDEEGVIKSSVWEARERGVIFDLGHGAGSFTFHVARRAMEQDFLPDSISTDVYAANTEQVVKDLLTTMSKFLNLGLSLEETLQRVTINPARAIGEKELGTLAPGAPADLALLRLDEGSFTFYDSRRETLEGTRQLTCEMTIHNGKIIYERKDK
ncbi:MAG: amidohydrolase/deacetylase family metallohydrolase [Anaerolineales bacterium]